jgi:glycosyltransferase involved in cell wall biosynthesis
MTSLPARPELLSVLVPVYNERATLRTAIERLRKADLPIPVEIVVIDDGSTDGAVETIADLLGTNHIRVARHRRNYGKGAAIRTGLHQATGDLTAVLDADLEYDPNDYRSLLEPILAGDVRVAYGTRTFSAHTAFSFWYVLGGKVLSFVTSALFNTWLSDVVSCLKIAPTDLWRSLDLRSDGFAFEAELTAKLLRAGERIYEAPISYRARSRAKGKKLAWTDGLSSLWVVLRIRFLGS